MKFLFDNGQIPENMRMHSGTNKPYWIFEMNDELSQLLTTWTNRKPNN